MIRLNLLPFRSSRDRTQHHRTQWFAYTIWISCIAIIGALAWRIDQKINRQTSLNQRQEQKVNELNRELHALQHHQKITSSLPNADNTRSTQHNHHTLQFLDTVTQSLPEGVTLRELKPSATGYRLYGHAATLAHLSTYLRALSLSKQIKKSQLIEFKHMTNAGYSDNEFIIDMEIVIH